MSDSPPEFSNWQEAWEWEAQRTSDAYGELSTAELLARVQAGRYDFYYTIWRRVQEKCTLAQAAPVLIDVLRREAGEPMMLIRYHCAGALFGLLGYPDEPAPRLRERVQWDHEGEPARQTAIDELEALIATRLSGDEDRQEL